MKKTAVIFWSGTGNTEAMANEVLAGMQSAGANAAMLSCSEVDGGAIDALDAVALGCPAMGAEVLEEEEFAPMFESIKDKLVGKKVALFGSYGWGDGEWIRTWAEDAEAAGARLVVEPVMANGSPDGDAETACAALGTALANA